ncbi:MAG TPA: UDP-3-O-acyl-N-acetylglucosamine deacetylase [Armatimonadota bacterium]|nr:UDP-3-O-acyl-N-acetylglucosamine deacetylase [Armatimonadota bacterium]
MGLSRGNRQRTLAERVTISGTGLHSGDRCVVVLHPAQADSGIISARNGERVQGIAENVVETARGTTIGQNGSRIRTIEHLMAALHGLGIDNACIEVQGSELPALDGSSMPYVEAILSIGTVDLKKPRSLLRLKEPVYLRSNGSFILAVPSNQPKFTYVLRHEHPLIGSQSATCVLTETNFSRDIAPARTFVMYEEIAGLISQHLAKGGSFDNAIVVWQDRTSSDLRFPDELARHKLLDLIGDVALVGGRLMADILAVKSGHALNVEFARMLTEHISDGESKEAA